MENAEIEVEMTPIAVIGLMDVADVNVGRVNEIRSKYRMNQSMAKCRLSHWSAIWWQLENRLTRPIARVVFVGWHLWQSTDFDRPSTVSARRRLIFGETRRNKN